MEVCKKCTRKIEIIDLKDFFHVISQQVYMLKAKFLLLKILTNLFLDKSAFFYTIKICKKFLFFYFK